MKTLKIRSVWSGMGLTAILSVAGCADKNQNGTPEVQVPEVHVDVPSANEIGKSVENAAAKVKKTAGPVVVKGVRAIETTAAPAVKVGEASLITGKVKAAIIANQTVDSSKINIDVKNNAVILRGRVKNGKEKGLVQTISQKQAPNYKIVNQLQIEGTGKSGKS